MQTDQFDDFAHRVAARWNRRGLLSAFAGGGVLVASGSRSIGPRTVSAEATCSLDLVATVRVGVNAGQFLWAGATQPGQIHGQLAFGVSPTGGLTEATFQLDDGTSLPVAGQATGYALQARIALGDARALILIGVGEQEIAACSGAVGGLMSGPQPGDLGDWQATATGLDSGAPASSTPTPAPTQPQNPATTGCAEGLVWCGQYCANLSNDPKNCGYCGTLCGQAESCIDGICLENAFCQPGMTNCGDACFDLTSDSRSCGACFVECGQDQVCWDGVCTNVDNCAGGLTNCQGVCVDTMSDPMNCSGCSIWCGDGQACVAGACVLTDHQCLENGQPCAFGEDCCSGLCGTQEHIWYECYTPPD